MVTNSDIWSPSLKKKEQRVCMNGEEEETVELSKDWIDEIKEPQIWYRLLRIENSVYKWGIIFYSGLKEQIHDNEILNEFYLCPQQIFRTW